MSRFFRIPIPSGGPVEEIDGRQDASYYPMTTGQGVVAVLIAARTGEFPRPHVMVVHANDPLAVKIDRLVELHLEQFRAALLEAIKGETSECEFHVLRPALELRLQLPDGDSCKCGAHLAEDTDSLKAQNLKLMRERDEWERIAKGLSESAFWAMKRIAELEGVE